MAGLEDVEGEAAPSGGAEDTDAAGAAPRPRKAAVLEDSDEEEPHAHHAVPISKDVPVADALQVHAGFSGLAVVFCVPGLAPVT